MNKLKTCVQAVHYLLNQLGATDKLKLVKLLFLADKLHLIRYGRTITGDTFYAMRKGPVGSVLSDVLTYSVTCDDEYLNPEEIEYCLENISPNEFCNHERNRQECYYRAKNSNLEYEQLSETDKDVINEIFKKFGSMKSGELVDLVHKYPEWKKHEKDLLEGKTKRAYIHLAEIFSTIPNDPLGIPPEIVQYSKELFLGC